MLAVLYVLAVVGVVRFDGVEPLHSHNTFGFGRKQSAGSKKRRLFIAGCGPVVLRGTTLLGGPEHVFLLHRLTVASPGGVRPTSRISAQGWFPLMARLH